MTPADSAPLTGSTALIVEIAQLKAQVATLTAEKDHARFFRDEHKARADKAESALATVTAERDELLTQIVRMKTPQITIFTDEP